MSDQKYSIEKIRNYILSQHSLGDVLYNLKPDKIAEANQPKIFQISGYWKEDGEEFDGYLVAAESDDQYDDDDYPDNDDEIFFYGLNEQQIKDAIEEGEEFEEDFVITGYTIYSY